MEDTKFNQLRDDATVLVNHIGEQLNQEDRQRFLACCKERYDLSLEQSKATSPETINAIEDRKGKSYVSLRNILMASLPCMPRPTGLLRVDNEPFGETYLGERAALWIGSWLSELAATDVDPTRRDTHRAWRDECIATGIQECLSDLDKISKRD